MATTIRYQDFAANRKQTLAEYVSFYQTRFSALFKWFYPSMKDDGFVPFATRYHNEERQFNAGFSGWNPHFFTFSPDIPKDELGIDHMDSEELYFFSTSVFFHALIPQVIWKVAGQDAWDLFCKAAAWPRMSAGLGGFVSAEQWLWESDQDLFPSPGEAPYYNTLLDIILGFHTEELTEFLKGKSPCADAESFSKLHEIVKDLVKPIAEELSAATEAAKVHFSNGEHPVYYLDFH